ncbi:hypothetical protein [Streptomyces sp. NBC_00483]
MIALSDAFLTVIYGAAAWVAGAAILTAAAAVAIARAIRREKTS